MKQILKQIRLVAGIVCLMAASQFCGAQTITVEIPASDNAFVLRGSANVQSTAQTLSTKRLNDSNTRFAYVRFNISSFLSSHSTNDVQSAQLRLFQLSGSADTVRVFGLNDVVTNSVFWPNGQSDGAWNGATMVFSNQPAGTNVSGQVPNNAGALPNPNSTPLLGSQTFAAAPPNEEVDIPLDTQTFINMLAADTNGQITLMFVNNGNNTPSWASLSNTSGFLVPTLEIVAASGSGGVVWTGSVNANWDTSTKNWLDTNSAPVAFASGNSAIFDDSSAVTSVALGAPLFPQAVVFNNNANTYTLGGSGKISGAASLSLNGSGTVILNEAGGNDFSGGVTINSGTLQIGNGGTGGNPGTGSIADKGVLVVNRSGSVIVSGAISGFGTVVNQGTGTTILTGGNNYSGGTTINAGTLQIGNGGITGSLGTSDVVDNSTLAFNHANDMTVALNISGTGGVSQNGTGALTLSGSEGYTGPTVINAGTLLVNTSLSTSSQVTNAAAGTLGGSGVISTPIRSAGQINPGAASVPGNLTVGALALDSGATLKFDLTNDATYGIGVNDLLTITGNLALNNNVIQANFLGVPQTGSFYHVIDYSGAKTGNFNPTVGGTHFTVTVDQSVANQISLLVSGSGANLKWNSTTSSNWDQGVSINWLNGASPDLFYGGDNVLFDDSVASVITNINLTGTLTPANVTNNSSQNYTFGGSGVISSSASLVKSGSGLLNISGNHTFTGPTIISGGMISMTRIPNSGVASPIGAGELVLDGGALQVVDQGAGVGGLTSTHNITLTHNGGGLDFTRSPSAGAANLAISGTLNLPDNGPRTLIFSGTDSTPLQLPTRGSFSEAIPDSPDAQPTTVVKNGNGAWRLTSANSYSGGTFINAGRATAGNASSFGSGLVTVASGAEANLNVSGAFANNFSIIGLGLAQQPNGESLDSQGAIHFANDGSSISGTVTLTGDARIAAREATSTGGTIDGQIVGNFNLEFGHAGGNATNGPGKGIVNLTSSANAWTGNTIISHGTVKIAGAGEVIPNGTGKGDVVMNGSGALSSGNILSILDLNGLNETINGLTSSNTASLGVVTNSSPNPAILVAGDNNANSTFGGVIADDITDGFGTLSLTKIGNGTLALTGANAYEGDTVVSNGVLIVSGSIGNATVFNSATLGGTATLNGNLTVSSSGTVAPGTSGLVGTLTVTGTAPLAGTSSMKLNAANGTSDQIVAGTLDYTGGKLTVSNLGGTLTNGTTFHLFSATAYPATLFSSITLPSLSGGLGWQTNLTVDGTIRVVSTGQTTTNASITSVIVAGTNVVISGTNNNGGQTFHYAVLTSTNVSLPLSAWTSLVTNSFNADGRFNYTNPITPLQPRQFYNVKIVP